MRPALMLLAITVFVILVLVRLRVERPELIMAAQQSGPEAPTWIAGRQEIIGGQPQSQVVAPVETELERFQRQRELYQRLYPHLGEAMQLDAKTESDLYDLLATQGLDFRGGEEDPPEIQDQVAAEKDAQLEKLLGEQTFRRFDEYRRMPATGDVSRLNASLGEVDRIRGEAIWRLTKLIHENSIYGSKDPLFYPSFETLPPEVEGSPQGQGLIFIARQEDHLRTLEQWNNRIESAAASFLTPVQLDALKRSHAETRESWHQSLQQLRAEVGMAPDGIIRRRIPLEGNIRTELTVTVNGEPVRFEHTGPNRERFGFRAGSGLWVEAIPTLYDDGWLDLLLAYFETRRGKPRQLDRWVSISCPTRQQNGASCAAHDAGTGTHRGLMEYKIRPTGIAATALERQ